MAAGNMTTTTHANFIPELWSTKVLEFRQANLGAADRVDRNFEGEFEFGDTLHVPNLTELTVRTKAASTDVTYETYTEAVTDIVINTHTYAAIKIEDILKVQAMPGLMEKYTSQFGYVLKKDIDTAITGRFDGFTQAVGTLLVPLTEADYRRAIQYLNDANAPQEGRSWFLSPAEMTNALGIDKFVNKDYSAATVNGAHVGTIYGIPVFETTNLEGSNGAGHDNALIQESAIALAVQQNVVTESQYDIDALAWKTVAHQIYGHQEMRDNHGVWMPAA